MGEWKKTSCVLCPQNCGLEVEIEENRIGKVRGDKSNPRSQGYMCVKGANVPWHQHHADRLTHPLKKTDGGFVRISWEQAIAEISEKLAAIVKKHGPRSYVYMGGGGQGCHFEAGFGTTLMKSLGSRYHYSALAQELTGYFWVCGRMLGSQNRYVIPDEHHSDMIVAIGWNGMESHQMPRAPLVLREFASNPDKLLAVIDPRKSETAKIANVHIALRPGTDALLVKAMIAIILKEGWEKRDYLAGTCLGFEKIEGWFTSFDIHSALSICEVGYEEVHALCREMATRRWCFHTDLGTLMNRHSTVVSYLQMLLAALCGRLCVAGGDVIPGTLMPIGSHSDERDPKTWRTVATNFPAIMGTFPPNVLPEEILSGLEERPRAVIVSGSNPLRSYADTTAYEEAFGKLDLLVTMEIAMTETAALSHYVLPARSGYESWDSTFFAWSYPDVFFHMRPPVVKPEGERLECGQIYTRLAKGLDIVPEVPATLKEAAEKDIFSFTLALFAFMRKNPKAIKAMPFVLAETLGRRDDSANKAALWGLLLAMPGTARRNAARAGFARPSSWSVFSRPGRVAGALGAALRYGSFAPLMALHPNILQSEMLYNHLLEHPEGIWIGKLDLDANGKELRTPDQKIHLHIPELEEPLKGIDPESERKALTPDSRFPLILNAGRHTRNVANTLMRDPAWLKGKRGCTLAIHPEDAAALGIGDGETVRITTQAGAAEIGAEVSPDVRKGQVLIPHGFGLVHRGTAYGVNVNYLTKNTHRDFLAATPLHRYVPCRVERIDGERP